MTDIEVVDPSTEEPFASVVDVEVAGASAAVDSAAAAFPEWSDTAPRVRSTVLRRAFELMVERSDELAETIVRENGKPIAEARGEVAYAAEFFRWFSEEAVRLHGSVVRAPGGGGHQVDMHGRQPLEGLQQGDLVLAGRGLVKRALLHAEIMASGAGEAPTARPGCPRRCAQRRSRTRAAG